MQLLDAPICDPFCAGENPVVAIRMFNGLGTIRIQLDPSAAPITVAYFLTLVKEGFYSGLKFHRIVPGFMIQGGDPTGTGDGETDYYLKGEFASNGVDNPLKHTRGVVSMARQDGNDTASCQFFILQSDSPFLDGEYTSFGKVIEGMDVVDRLADNRLNYPDSPIAPLIMQRVYLEE